MQLRGTDRRAQGATGWLLGLLCCLGALPAVAALPRPSGLEPEIAFWLRIFTEVDSAHALVHDDRHLAVVYEELSLPAQASAAQRRRLADRARQRYRKILLALAAGKRKGLSHAERRVLSLWPEGVSNAELRRAARRIRFQQGLADRFRDGLVRSGRWRPYIEQALAREGVPLEVAALPHVESSFNPDARSHVGAAGLWQFTRSTGRRFMQVDHVVDARRDPFLSSDAAAQLLSYNYSILQSWPLAITAYNHGVAGMRRAVRRVGSDDIEAIVHRYDGRAFGFASRNFYVALLAAVEAEQRAAEFFGPLEPEPPQARIVVRMPDYVPAAAVAEAFGLPLRQLQRMNPALLEPVWQGSKYIPRGFPLRLPAEPLADSPQRLLASLPQSRRFDEQTPDLYHRVRRGESLSVIARRYHTSVSELVALNGLRSRHRIRAGQVLRLPYAGAPAARPAIDPNAPVYVVRAGDTLGGIAARAGLATGELAALNGISDRDRIYPGQRLQLRAAMAAVAKARPAVAVAVEDVAAPPAGPAGPVDSAPAAPVGPVADVDAAAVAAALSQPPDEAGGELLADPSDYLVAGDGTIEIQAAETLGHYADWLELRTQRLRDLNGYAFRRPVVIGQRLKLDFSRVDPETFVARRIAYHRQLQEAYFTRYRVTETTVHRLRRGESVWELTRRRYRVPVWLLRQYNPDLDLDRVRPGVAVLFPRVEPVDQAAGDSSTLAEAS
ncbi:MAG: LysM peptidoglycan-binding domain-containing protein [Gammaproteobacteria bacterium]|nr:MAG: LysM peptidoglycan-binding domain-containing protein [Gammaproteobacteria bacterium]